MHVRMIMRKEEGICCPKESFATTWESIYEKIKTEHHGELAQKLVDCLVYFGPEVALPTDILDLVAAKLALKSEVELSLLLSPLIKYSLLDTNENNVSIHGVVQKIIRNKHVSHLSHLLFILRIMADYLSTFDEEEAEQTTLEHLEYHLASILNLLKEYSHECNKKKTGEIIEILNEITDYCEFSKASLFALLSEHLTTLEDRLEKTTNSAMHTFPVAKLTYSCSLIPDRPTLSREGFFNGNKLDTAKKPGHLASTFSTRQKERKKYTR